MNIGVIQTVQRKLAGICPLILQCPQHRSRAGPENIRYASLSPPSMFSNQARHP
jgi:hypothetical protein